MLCRFIGLDQALGHGFFLTLAVLLALFSLIAGVIGLFKLDLKMIAYLGIVAIMAAVVLAQRYLGRHIIKGKVLQIDSLSGAFYPVIVVNDRPLFSPEELAELKEEYKAKNHPQENPAISTSAAKNESEPEKASSSGSPASAVLFCKKCGKRIPSNSLFCQFCGDPVDTSIAGSTEGPGTATTNTAHEAVSPSARKADGNGQMEKELAEYNNLLKTHQISKSEYDILVRITTDKYTNMQH